MNRLLFLILLQFILTLNIKAQINIGENVIDIDYANPKEYEIGGITVSGVEHLDQNVLLLLSGLSVGDKIAIPGDRISSAVKKLWTQGLFEDIKITATKIVGDIIFLDIHLTERPRLLKFRFLGISKSDADNLREKLEISRGDVVTENLLLRVNYKVKKYYVEKGFLNVGVDVKQVFDDSASTNKVSLDIHVKKNKRVRIERIHFDGNKQVNDGALRRSMKETKEKTRIKPLYQIDLFLFETFKTAAFHYRKFDIDSIMDAYIYERFRISFFKGSKFIAADYASDKSKVIEKYNELGYRDAIIVHDSVVKQNSNSIKINIKVSEGPKYYFRNISWVGNTKYTSEQLNNVLRIEKGDIYNQKLLENNLYGSMEGRDVSSLYMDDGYLFFNVTPVEMLVENDSIDLELRIYEGKQASISKIIVKGNTRTNDHVIYREMYTRPGQLFSKSNIMRTQRELAQLRYFNAETMGVNPIPNPQDGTVDIEYQVEETSTDQVELSGGWGYGRFIGTLGLSFNNFSLKNIFNWSSYQPLPTGDGQTLSLRAQTSGKYYQNYSFSFTEPWLGGKKPNSLTVSLYHSALNYSEYYDVTTKMKIYGISVGLGKRLKWPDDYFTLYHGVSLQNYEFKNYNILGFADGYSNNLNYNIIIGRNSLDAPIFPRTGSDISLSVQLTPPYSMFDNVDNYDELSVSEKYKWIEYHKWKFNFSYNMNLVQNLVLNTRAKYGFLGKYNRSLGDSPFERFFLGGDGMTSGYGSNFVAKDLIGLRGYDNYSITPADPVGTSNYIGATVFNKYTVELKYPLSLNPSATIYVLTFAEGGNTWLDFKDYNAYDIKRSAGMGLRLFLPMLGGLLGFDWGYGFDEVEGNSSANKGHFHFSINQSID